MSHEPLFGQKMTRFTLTGLLLISLALPPARHAEAAFPPIAAGVESIPAGRIFASLRDAYGQFHFDRAIREAKRLKWQRTDPAAAEAAAYILGELYTAMAERGRPLRYKDAISALRDARVRYPRSSRALPALWKIGKLYIRRGLYYEALASFRRILKKHPDSRYAVPARLGIAETYLAWEKWEKGIAALDRLDPTRLASARRITLLLGYADAHYHLGDMAAAYRYYRLISPKAERLTQSPKQLLQYGSAAFEAGDYQRARTVLTTLYRRYPRSPEAPLALVRIGDAWRLERFGQPAKKFYDEVLTLKRDRPGALYARLAAAVGKLHLAGCRPRPVLVTAAACRAIRAKVLQSPAGIDALSEIRKAVGALLAAPERSLLRDELLLEAVRAMEQHGAYTAALAAEEAILEKRIPFRFRKKLEAALETTVVNAAAQQIQEKGDLELLAIYFRYPDRFSPKGTGPQIRFEIGLGLQAAGLFKEAAALMAQIAQDRKEPLAEAALFHLTQNRFLQGDYRNAETSLTTYLRRYPKGRHTPSLLALAARTADQQGRTKEAIGRYKAWLKRYPAHPLRKTLRSLLAEAYETVGKRKAAIAAYHRLISEEDPPNPAWIMKIADLYYLSGDYPKAADFYRRSKKAAQDGKGAEWAVLQLAKVQRILGRRDSGQAALMRLAKEAEDPLIRAVSAAAAKEGR